MFEHIVMLRRASHASWITWWMGTKCLQRHKPSQRSTADRWRDRAIVFCWKSSQDLGINVMMDVYVNARVHSFVDFVNIHRPLWQFDVHFHWPVDLFFCILILSGFLPHFHLFFSPLLLLFSSLLNSTSFHISPLLLFPYPVHPTYHLLAFPFGFLLLYFATFHIFHFYFRQKKNHL